MDFAVLVQACAPWVAHQTMAAIVKTESAFQPLAIGINGGARLARQPETREEAVATATWLLANGYNIDIGLGQINSNNLLKAGLSIEDAFEPCKNIAAAATILTASYQTARRKGQGEQAALQAALSAYNTGSFSKGFSNGYVQKVVGHAAAAVAGASAQATAPIPLVGAKPATPAVTRRAQPIGSVVRRTAQKAGPATEPGPQATVEHATANAMVY